MDMMMIVVVDDDIQERTFRLIQLPNFLRVVSLPPAGGSTCKLLENKS